MARPNRAATPPRVTIARIARPRGIRGEVIADLLTDFPERLSHLQRVFLAPAGGHGPEREFPVRRCWLHQGRAVFLFEGVDSMATAETLRGMEVRIPLEERVELPSGKYFVSDLAGCELLDTRGKPPAVVGVVRDVIFETGVPLLIVDTAKGELLIPFAEEICTRIDPAAGRIEISPPEGLLDLNE